MRNYLTYLAAFSLGAGLVFAFAPFNLWLLSILMPGGLLLLWLSASPKQAFWQGLSFGAGFFGLGVSWIYVSLHVYGELSPLFAGIITVLFVLLLALFPAAQGYLLAKTIPHSVPGARMLSFPLVWVLFEWLRSWVLTGFPWLLLGYSQLTGWLKGYIPVLGEYGTAFIATSLSAGLAAIVHYRSRHRYSMLLLISLVFVGGYGLATVSWTERIDRSVSVALIQANIPQQLKWTPDYLDTTLKQYLALTQLYWGREVILWSEAAIPLPLPWAEPLIDDLIHKARIHNSTLLTGIPIQSDSGKYYNALVALGQWQGEYHKRRLVPFGDYVPFYSLIGNILDILKIPISDSIAGVQQFQGIQLGDVWIVPFICYEIAYSSLLDDIDAHVHLLVTVSNNAWFGDSLAPYQHVQIAQFRALQLGRYHLFSTSNGITAIISQQGEIIERAPQFVPATVSGVVPLFVGSTPWQKLGNGPIIGICVFLLLGVVWRYSRVT